MQMRVQIGRQTEFGVTERLRHLGKLDARREQETRRGVPQVVNPDARQVCGTEQGVEDPQHIPRM